MTEVKRMSAKEFRDGGYLQEVNRRFLHLVGLALYVVIDDETDEVKYGGVIDYRDDPEGIVYSKEIACSDEFKRKRGKVAGEYLHCLCARWKALGFGIQRPGEYVPEESVEEK